MIPFAGLLSGTNTARSITANDQEMINRYVERLDGGLPKAQENAPVTPSIQAYTSIGTGPGRGLFSQDNRAFGVGGTLFGEILTNHGVRVWGQVEAGPQPVTMASNGKYGHQIMITSAGLGYIFDTVSGVFSQITDTDFPANVLQCVYFDGYFVVLATTDGRFQISRSYDGLVWNALDFAIVNTFSDLVVGMTRTHDNLWLFGTQNTLAYYDAGDANFPIIPIPSGLIEHGTAAPFSCVELDNRPFWFGQDITGAGMVWSANGYTPTRVSTHAIEATILMYGNNLSQSTAWGYQEQGHTFYCLDVPGLDWTLVYDIATGLWHKRATWVPELDQWKKTEAIWHAYCWDKHFVQDRFSGTVYEQSLSIYPDLMAP